MALLTRPPVAHVQLNNVIGQRIWHMGPVVRGPWRCAALVDTPLPHRWAIEADQAHEGRIMTAARRAFMLSDPEQVFSKAGVLDERDHLALDGCALTLSSSRRPKLLQKVEESPATRPRPAGRPVTTCLRYTAVPPASHPGEPLATQASARLLLNYFHGLSHGPPPSEVSSLL